MTGNAAYERVRAANFHYRTVSDTSSASSAPRAVGPVLTRACGFVSAEWTRARGVTGGRPTVWTAEKQRTALAMYESGEHDVAGIARVLGVSRASVYRVLQVSRSP